MLKKLDNKIHQEKESKMRKITFLLLVIQSGIMMAQTKTVVTPNGERVTINPYANNGLTLNNGFVQLGGSLTKPTTIKTSDINTLAISGLLGGAVTDNLMMVNSAGVLNMLPSSSLSMWSLGGNKNGVLQTLGTNNAFDLPFKTKNAEWMRITSTGKVGMGTSAPANNVEVNGVNGTGSGLKLPTGASLGKMLTADASGNAYWQSSAIQLQLTVTSIGAARAFQNTTKTDWKLIDFFSVVDTDGAKTIYGSSFGWDTATSSYKVARSGSYRLLINMYALGTVSAVSNGLTATAGDDWRVAAILNNNNTQSSVISMPFISVIVGANDQSVFVSGVANLKAGDVLSFKTVNNSSTTRPAIFYAGPGHSIITIESL